MIQINNEILNVDHKKTNTQTRQFTTTKLKLNQKQKKACTAHNINWWTTFTQAMNIEIFMINTTTRIGITSSMKTRTNGWIMKVIEFKNGNNGETIRVTLLQIRSCFMVWSQTRAMNTVHWMVLLVDQTRRALDAMELLLKPKQKHQKQCCDVN